MKVMISGSRSIKTLPKDAIARIETIISLNAEILIGDCNGVDSAVQQYLKQRGYYQVFVYHIGKKPRCNVGFPTVAVPGSRYLDKDVAMCTASDYGLAIIANNSRGTLANIARMPGRVRVVQV